MPQKSFAEKLFADLRKALEEGKIVILGEEAVTGHIIIEGVFDDYEEVVNAYGLEAVSDVRTLNGPRVIIEGVAEPDLLH